ncbi:ABC transporter permease [Candidatus Azambacteria bacterium]|nr:ABC transporter permease [Candidatus Azambacteria bacterium]
MRRIAELLSAFIRSDFALRYRDSLLGFLWVLVKPFLLFLILFVVFSRLFGAQDPQYTLKLLLGILLFSYFSEGTSRGLSSLVERAEVLTRIHFPRGIAVGSPVVSSFLNFLAAFAVFFLVRFFLAPEVPVSLLGVGYFFGLVILLTFFILGISFFASILFVRFRDLGIIWDLALQLLFFATPILYPLEFLPARLRDVALWNPLAVVILESKSALIAGSFLGAFPVGLAILIALVVFFAGYFAFLRFVPRVIEYL